MVKKAREYFTVMLEGRHVMAGKLRKSAEDYLEAILMLKEKNGQVRSIDIADLLEVTKPSVSNAVKRLREKGYIEMDASSFITLTDTGYEIARNVYERHQTITDLFVSLGVDREIAQEDACRIEHILSEQSYKALMTLKDKLDS